MKRSYGKAGLYSEMHIHFVGIAGTAMGNVALMMRAMGHVVTGSDENVYPPMSDLLADAGCAIMNGFGSQNLDPTPDLVVIGNRMSRGNEEVEAVLERRLAYTSLPELLKRELIQGRTSIVLTGTHGKTTASSMMAWILESSGSPASFMIGGAPGNFTAGWQYSPESSIVVLEGDEYDTAFFDKRSKFVHYLPSALLINNLEFDHADIYDSLAEIKLSFRRLVNIVPRNGVIVANGDDENVIDVLSKSFAPVQTFGLGAGCMWRASSIQYRDDATSFDIERDGVTEARITMSLTGEFNVRNALGATVIARWLGISYDDVDVALQQFINARRRLEVKGEYGGVRVYDDFAHHPTAIRATLRAIRVRHPQDRIWAVFEPRSNTTRRRVFQRELAECFADADIVALAQVDRLDELPVDERLDPDILIEDIRAQNIEAHYLENAGMIARHIGEHARPGDIVVVMSNGGFDGIHRRLADALTSVTST